MVLGRVTMEKKKIYLKMYFKCFGPYPQMESWSLGNHPPTSEGKSHYFLLLLEAACGFVRYMYVLCMCVCPIKMTIFEDDIKNKDNPTARTHFAPHSAVQNF